MNIKHSSRNATIELLRFIMAMIIMTFHFFCINIPGDGLIYYAVYCVEFFFILSGFLMMKHILTSKEPLNEGSFLFKKIRSFYAPFIMMFSVQFVIYVTTRNITSVQETARALFYFKWEILLLQTAGFIQGLFFDTDYLLGQAWYLSAMMLALLILYPIAKKFQRNFVIIICPTIVLLSYGYLIQSVGHLNIVDGVYFNFISPPFLRAIAGTCLGCIAYLIYEYLYQNEQIWNAKFGRFIEILSYLFLLAFFFIGGSESTYMSNEDGLFFVLVFIILIILAMLDCTPITHYLNTHGTNISSYLGSFSLYLYLVHWPILSSMLSFSEELNESMQVFLYYFLCLTLSTLLMLFDQKRKTTKPVIIFVIIALSIAFIISYFNTATYLY